MTRANSGGFRWLPSYYEAVRELPDRERLLMYDAILDYGFGNPPPELPPLLAGYFRLIAPTLDTSIKFEKQKRDNGTKGGRPRKAESSQKQRKTGVGKNQSETKTEKIENLNETKTAETENLNETKTEKEENLDIDVDLDLDLDDDLAVSPDLDDDLAVERADRPRRASRFTPPTVEQVSDYCRERHNGVDARRFVDFYAAKGWKIGKEGMKDWQAAVRTWESRDGGTNIRSPDRYRYEEGESL